jgi:hypothetical protein
VNLHFCMYGAYDAGEQRHPQNVMRDLGITYLYAVPQSIADCWQFYCCQNVPAELPTFLTTFERKDPHASIGYGLDREMADAIAAYDAKEQP